MSARTTAIRLDGMRAWLIYGHAPRAEAIRQAREHYAYVQAQAARMLAILDSGDPARIQVFHQNGIHKVTNRREVRP